MYVLFLVWLYSDNTVNPVVYSNAYATEQQCLVKAADERAHRKSAAYVGCAYVSVPRR
jgi:hypothetical protein